MVHYFLKDFITVEKLVVTIGVGDQQGGQFEDLGVTVDTGSTFTAVPRALLQRLGVPVRRSARSRLADGSSVPVDIGWTVVRLEDQIFATQVTFAEQNEPSLLFCQDAPFEQSVGITTCRAGGTRQTPVYLQFTHRPIGHVPASGQGSKGGTELGAAAGTVNQGPELATLTVLVACEVLVNLGSLISQRGPELRLQASQFT